MHIKESLSYFFLKKYGFTFSPCCIYVLVLEHLSTHAWHPLQKIYDALNPWVIMNSTIAATPKNSLTPTLSTFLIASMIHMANLLNQLTIVKLKYNNYLLRKQQITTSKGSFIGLKKFLLSWFKMETL